MPNDALIRWSFFVGLAMMVLGVLLNYRQGGQLWAYPFHYTRLGFWVYWGGLAVMIVGSAAANFL